MREICYLVHATQLAFDRRCFAALSFVIDPSGANHAGYTHGRRHFVGELVTFGPIRVVGRFEGEEKGRVEGVVCGWDELRILQPAKGPA